MGAGLRDSWASNGGYIGRRSQGFLGFKWRVCWGMYCHVVLAYGLEFVLASVLTFALTFVYDMNEEEKEKKEKEEGRSGLLIEI